MIVEKFSKQDRHSFSVKDLNVKNNFQKKKKYFYD